MGGLPDHQIVIEPDLLLCKAGGRYSLELLIDSITEAGRRANEAGLRKVLLDCRSWSAEISEGERFQAGLQIAATFGERIKGALVAPTDRITKLGELTARNRGTKFLVTDSEDEARAFLSRA